jgi:signal transduction histidine kinase
MPPGSRIGRFFARTDTRAVASIASVILLGLSLQGFLLYAYVAMEGLEEADRWLEHSLDTLVPWIESGDSLEAAMGRLEVAARVKLANGIQIRDPQGAVIDAWGVWPQPGRIVEEIAGEDSRTLGSWRLLLRENFLVGHAPLSSGDTLALSLSLAHFSGEAAEVGRGILFVTLGSGVLALVIAAFATMRAFAPLRRATVLLREVDAQQLERRLPTRKTMDPVDVHAETLNEVLAKIDDAFDRLKAFSSDSAHELRTPLNRMINVSEVALLGDKDEELRDALESVNATTHDLARMVSALLLLAELDDERLELPRDRLRVSELIERAVAIAAPGSADGSAPHVIASDDCHVEGEGDLLTRALANLLENAIRYPGAVEVRTERSGSFIHVAIDDDGPGVPIEHRARIFDRFTRLPAGGSRGHSGVGLALARAIARAHGGTVSVADSRVLKGARFVLTLPIASA